MSVLNLVHELCHSFGASHDSDECFPNDVIENGHYLMSPYSNNGRMANHDILSNCTIKSIQETLSGNSGNCLRDLITMEAN